MPGKLCLDRVWAKRTGFGPLRKAKIKRHFDLIRLEFEVMQIVNRLKEWVFQPPERRRAERLKDPDTVAYYWDGSVPVPREIRDISLQGAYLCTPERWYVGTIVKLALKTNRPPTNGRGESIQVTCKVIRHGEDGVGLQFISQEVIERKGLHRFLMSVMENLSKSKRIHSEDSVRGQALIEFAFMMPVIFFMLIIAINYGGLFYAWITCANAARAGAQYAVLGHASAGSPSTPSSSAIQKLITGSGGDTSSLPSNVSICITKTGTASTCYGPAFTPPALPADPEASTYSLVAIDIKYTYSPFWGSFTFPGLGISLPTMPTTIQMRTVMRVLN